MLVVSSRGWLYNCVGACHPVARDLLLDLTQPLAPVKIVWDTSLELDRLVSELQRVNLSMQNQHTEAIWPWSAPQRS